MSSLLLVNADGPEKRIALLENSELAEFYIERQGDYGIVGNVYKGRAVRVLPGMQAAFVDIGIGRAAFLYVADLSGMPGDLPPLVHASGEERPELGDEEISRTVQTAPIQERIHEGQEILVQVAKEPIGTKGARITSYISLPGRHLVLMPNVDHVGISRRIVSEKERKRLRETVEAIRPPGTGFIVRTAAEGHSKETLQADMEFLLRVWADIQERNQSESAPSLLYRDLDLSLRVVRDLFSGSVERIIVDERHEYDRLCQFVESFSPEHRGAVELHQGIEPLFDRYGLEMEIDRSLERKVWLKSGGYLIIDQSEALTSIDVNTGRYVGRRSLEDTITKINLEAVKEVASQLRLRNLGGIIVIDFIDMENERNREKVWHTLLEALKKDRAKSNVLPISELGLVEMTRKRVRESLSQQLTEPCPYCEGRGHVKSTLTVCYEVLREIRRQAAGLPGNGVLVRVQPEVADLLSAAEQVEWVTAFERRFGKSIRIEPHSQFHVEQFEINVTFDD